VEGSTDTLRTLPIARKYKQYSNLSQERFVDRAGLNRTYDAGIARGESAASMIQLAKMDAALSIPRCTAVQRLRRYPGTSGMT